MSAFTLAGLFALAWLAVGSIVGICVGVAITRAQRGGR